jgi:hypothetical protein
LTFWGILGSFVCLFLDIRLHDDEKTGGIEAGRISSVSGVEKPDQVQVQMVHIGQKHVFSIESKKSWH